MFCKININCNYSFSRNSKNTTQNYGNIKPNKNYIETTTVYRPAKFANNKDNEFRYNKKLSNSLNLSDYGGEEYSPKNIKIIKNNQYILNLNSITIDVDQINKDKSIMDINCSSLEDELISTKKLYPDQQNNNNSQKNHIQIKRIKKNYFDDNTERMPIKNASKQTPSTKNSMQYDIIENNNFNNIKKDFNNMKMNNKSKENIKKKKKIIKLI